MSFETVEAESAMIKNVTVVNINGATYPPSTGLPTVPAYRAVIGTGLTPPANVVAASQLKITQGIGQTKLSTEDGTAVAIYDTMFPKGTGNAGDVLTCDGLGASDWLPPSGGSSVYPTSIVVPWFAFDWYNLYQDAGTSLNFKVDGLNSLTPAPVTNGQNLGTKTITLRAGTWRFSLTLSGGGGILDVTINGVTTSIDSYLGGSQNYTMNWQQDFLTDGDYTVNYTNGGKNGSSSSYDIQGRNTSGLLGFWLGAGP